MHGSALNLASLLKDRQGNPAKVKDISQEGNNELLIVDIPIDLLAELLDDEASCLQALVPEGLRRMQVANHPFTIHLFSEIANDNKFEKFTVNCKKPDSQPATYAQHYDRHEAVTAHLIGKYPRANDAQENSSHNSSEEHSQPDHGSNLAKDQKPLVGCDQNDQLCHAGNQQSVQTNEINPATRTEHVKGNQALGACDADQQTLQNNECTELSVTNQSSAMDNDDYLKPAIAGGNDHQLSSEKDDSEESAPNSNGDTQSTVENEGEDDEPTQPSDQQTDSETCKFMKLY